MLQKPLGQFRAIDNILVLDAGTTGIKAFVFDGQKNVISRSYKKIGKTVNGNIVEQDPLEILKTSIETIKEAVDQSGLSPGDIKGISITNQRETFVLWDKATGEPACPAIVWEDTRTSDFCEKNKDRYGEIIKQKTGLALDPYFSATKISWALNNIPKAQELYGKNSLFFGTIDTWLIWNLGSSKPYVTDYTNASRTLLFDIRDLKWDEELLKIFGLSSLPLPLVLPSRSEFGKLDPKVFGYELPILAICGDQQASMFAAGTEPGTTKVTFGTGTFIMQILQDFVFTEGLFTTLVPGKNNVMFAAEAKIPLGGKNVEPLLGKDAELDAFLRDLAKKVNSQLIRLPYGAQSLTIDGGITQAKSLASILAEETGVEIRTQKIFDGTALGAAMLAE